MCKGVCVRLTVMERESDNGRQVKKSSFFLIFNLSYSFICSNCYSRSKILGTDMLDYKNHSSDDNYMMSQ